MNEQAYDKTTYRRLRRAIGYIGFFLPIILVIFSLPAFFETAIQPSISHYYYTNLRELFTGSLCAVGLFMIRYKGFSTSPWWKNDNFLTNVAGAMAFGVAFIPTNPNCSGDKIYTLIPSTAMGWGYVHYGFAAILFSAFAMLSIKVFTIGQSENTDIPISWINENKIYRFCGYAIIFCIAGIVLLPFVWDFAYITLLMEALALFAFGSAWLIKGRALGDTGILGQKIYRELNEK